MRYRFASAVVPCMSLVLLSYGALPAAGRAEPKAADSRGLSSFIFGGGGGPAMPSGELDVNANNSAAFVLFGNYNHGAIGVRASLGGFDYAGDEISSLEDPRAQTIHTGNSLLLFSCGPQLALVQGPVVPYIYGGIGLCRSWSFVERGSEPGEGQFHRTNLAWQAGGGLVITLVRVDAGRHPLLVDIAANHAWNGTARYFPDDSIQVSEGGAVQFTTVESEINCTLLHFSFAIGF